jgi:hypothetical protein
MRSLAQPKVILHAGIAALLTSLAGYARIASWFGTSGSVPFACGVFLWSTFVLWSFVFAWQPEYAGKPPLKIRGRPGLWAGAVLYGVVLAALLRAFVDPQLRVTSPTDYPANFRAWIEMSLFTLAFDPLFLCFAPFAFFIRLFRRQTTALALTVIFVVFICFLKLNSAKQLPPSWLVVEVLARAVVAGFISVYFYLEGGAVLVWLPTLLVQTRHLPDFLH